MSRKFVLAIAGAGANDAIRGMVAACTEALSAVGLPVVHVTADEAELSYAVEQMKAGNVAFGFTWLGIGQYIPVRSSAGQTINAWEAFEVPLLKYHGDIPAYFQDLHSDTPRNAVNLYPALEFLSYRRRWMPDCQAITALVPPFALAPVPLEAVDLNVRRRGTLVFLKNGNSPQRLRTLWTEALPKSVASLLASLVEHCQGRAMTSVPIDLGAEVDSFLTHVGIESPTLRQLAPFFVAQLDDLLRREKSALIARALLDLPVVIQGDHWEHVDFTGRRAKHRPGQDFASSRIIFERELGVVDMSPNISTGGHERVLRAAGAYALVLTNRQQWISDSLPGFEDFMFDFTTESIVGHVTDALDHPEQYLEKAIEFGTSFRRTFPAEAFGNRVIDLAELAVLQHASIKPTLQPFFVWPRGR